MEEISAKVSRMAVGCLSNNPEVLNTNLMASEMLQSGRVPIHVAENPSSAAQGYNQIIAKADADYLILAHNDVYLPPNWEELLAYQIQQVEKQDPNWGVLTAYGVDQNGGGWGPVWSTSIGQIMGRVPMQPTAVTVADELLIVVRKVDGLVFDEALDHFHFYGLDIVQTSLAMGRGTWSVALPCVHNDSFKPTLDDNYDRCFHYVRKKWRSTLPISAPTVKVTWHGLQLIKVKKGMRESFEHRKNVAATSQADPKLLAAYCGWERIPQADAKSNSQQKHKADTSLA